MAACRRKCLPHAFSIEIGGVHWCSGLLPPGVVQSAGIDSIETEFIDKLQDDGLGVRSSLRQFFRLVQWLSTATKRLGGGPPMKEYFLVAIADRNRAVKALRERRQLLDVQITVAGQATDEYLEWLDVRPGEIFCVMAVS